jgi:hypothetical protein
VGKPEGKRLPGRPRRRSEGNIKMDLRDIIEEQRWDLVNTVMNILVPWNVGNS